MSKFKIGDVIARKDNFNDKYVVTGLGTYMGKPTIYGFNDKGQPLDGSTGCTNPERYALVTHTDEIEDIIMTYLQEEDFKDKFMASDGTIIYNCPDWMDNSTYYIVARQSTNPPTMGKWYYWSDFEDNEIAKEVAEDIGGRVFAVEEIEFAEEDI